ncbi:VapE domain-containing protein [Litchfieldella xinjiangensis]|uniref:VapE domain-containing protein n=1 Tax=Litchfieldella xinjiangensis TaxID=1166948 RepID=UPI0006946D46|nr:VapE domain-containing protein [Halomonas xinjiangensis]
MMTADSIIDKFRAAMRQQGINVCEQIIADGKIHRYHVEGDRKGSRNAWAILYIDDKPAGSFGCAKRHGIDAKFSWSAKRPAKPLSREERQAWHEKMQQQQAEKAALEAARHAAAAARARDIWDNAHPVDAHPYLAKKGIGAHGARLGVWELINENSGVVSQVTDNALLIPISKLGVGVVSLQAIFPDANNFLERDRDYLKGGEKKGCYFGIGTPRLHDERKVFIVCEGFATGAAIHEATGHCVIVAFDTSNLATIATAMRQRQPEAIIVLAADNDQWTTRPVANPGVHYARAAATIVKGRLAIPPFDASEGEAQSDGQVKGPTDFDDLRRLRGDDAVKAVLEACLNDSQGPDTPPASPAVSMGAQMAEQGTAGQVGDGSLLNQGTLRLPTDIGVIPLGTTGYYYGFWRRSTGRVELIRQQDILHEAQLLRLADRTLWEQWCLNGPGKLDRSYIGNHLAQVCQHLGEISISRVPSDLANAEEARLALSIAWLTTSPSAGHLVEVLRLHPDWRDVGVWRNLLSTEIHCDHAPPWGGEAGVWGDDHDRQLSAWVAQQLGISVSARLAGEAIEGVANQAPRHPVRDYLESLTWDGTPRLDTWLTDCAGVEATPYSQAVGARTLIAAVARAIKPGCKVDTMLVLEGPQGLKKSSLIAALVPDERWLAEDLGADIGDKDALQALRGKWIIELAEMANMARSQVRKVKQFLSSRVDRYRPSYGRCTKDFPRQAIFIGTINPEGGGGYLSDPTGGRRFWPVVCVRVDIERMQTEREQLWAEAVARYRQGEPWWLDSATEAVAREEQAARQIENPWEERVCQFIDELPPTRAGGCWGGRRAVSLTETTTAEVFQAFEGRLAGDRDMRDLKRIKAAFVGLGWAQGKQTLASGRRVKCWRAPSP